MAITFDGPTQRIVLDSTNHSAAEIWSRYVDWHALNPQWPLAMRYTGGEVTDPVAGKFSPRFFFVINDWAIRPMEADHDLTIEGFLIKEGGGSPFVRTLGAYQVNVTRDLPSSAEGIATAGSSAPTASQVSDAVWAKILEAGETAADMLRLKRAAVAGAGTVPLGPGPFSVSSADGGKVRIAGTIGADGTRTVPTVDGTL